MELRNQDVDLDGLQPHPQNYNRHPAEQVKRLAKSLTKFGQVRSVVVWRNTLLAGHGVAEAARILNWRTVRADVLPDDYPEHLALAYVAADNELARQGDPDMAQLAAILEQSKAADAELLEAIGYSDKEFETLLAEVGKGAAAAAVGDTEPEVDRAEELREKWGICRGQLWQLEEHRLMCASCLEIDNVRRLLGGASPKIIFADPPYGVNIVAANVTVGGGEGPNGMIPFGGVKNRGKGHVGGGESYRSRHGHWAIEETKKSKRLGAIGGAKPFGSKDVRGSIGASNVVDVGKYAPIIGDETTDTAVQSSAMLLTEWPKAVHVWWGGNYYADKLPPSSCWLVWNKETTGNFADCELAWTNQPRAAKLFTHRWNGMLRDSERGRRMHPTQKPTALAAWVFGELGQAGDVVLDPFCGCGPTIIAGEETGRKVFGMELSEEYVAITLERWAQHTGKTPRLVETVEGDDAK